MRCCLKIVKCSHALKGIFASLDKIRNTRYGCRICFTVIADPIPIIKCVYIILGRFIYSPKRHSAKRFGAVDIIPFIDVVLSGSSPPKSSLLNPSAFIIERKLTVIGLGKSQISGSSPLSISIFQYCLFSRQILCLRSCRQHTGIRYPQENH